MDRQEAFIDISIGQRLIDINLCELLFCGGVSCIYQHPDDSGLLIKILREPRQPRRSKLRTLLKSKISHKRSFGRFASYQREVREMFRSMSRQANTGKLGGFPFARILGFAQTSMGFGIVVEKILTSNGLPAPTLRNIVKAGRYTELHQKRLAEFFDICIQNHLILNDANTGNLVFQDQNGGRFVCVDGGGEKSFLPIHEWSFFANRLKLERARLRMSREIARLQSRGNVTVQQMTPAGV